MQIFKKRLKNLLNHKITKNQLTSYNIFYIIIDSSQTITTVFKKKILTKLLFNRNFNVLKNFTFNYPILYISLADIKSLLKTYNELTKHNDFKKILICNIKAKFLIFKDLNTLNLYYLHNNLLIYYKLYFMLNILFISFLFFKKNIK